jgi:predicted dehydrogenase
VGYGSIGKRHARNLENLGHEVIPLDINYKLRFDVDCAFICTPTQFHVEHAVEYISKGVPTFIEKPLTHSLFELRRLRRETEGTKTITMVACNNRFHPSLLKAKGIADSGKVVFARAEAGYFLPFWRPTDYKKSYSASEYGGIVLDDIHSVDFLCWMFGKLKVLKMVCGKVSDLEIKREDIAEISMLFESGVSASVHCDYLMKNYHKQLSLYLPHEVVTYKIHPTNLMYKKEIEYFLQCVRNKEQPMNGITEAGEILEAVLQNRGDHTGSAHIDQAAEKSSKKNK